MGAALNFANPTLTIAAGTTTTAQLTLSVPAPQGGVPVTFSASNGGIVSMPFGTNIASNSGGVNLQITGLNPGTTVITAASSMPNITPATLTITVPGAVINGTITLPVGISVTAGQSTPFPITLGAPAPVDVTISLLSSDGSKLTVSPASVLILAGATTPASQPQVTGVSTGSANVSATASGYSPASQPVTVTGAGNIALTPPTLALVVGVGQNLTATIPSVAPGAGKTVTLSSSDPSVATVPASVTVLSGASTVLVPVTPVGSGSTTITATSSGQGSASSTITVSATTGIVLVQDVVVAPGQTKSYTVMLASPAASATTVNLVSSDGSKLSISPSSISFNAGQTAPVSQPSITGIAEGTANITASGAGLTSANASVRVGYTLAFTPATLTVVGVSTQNLTLNLSSASSSNLTISLASLNAAAATVNATAIIPAGSTSISIPVTGVSPGSALITASTSSIPSTSATVNVVANNALIVPAVTNALLGKVYPFVVTLPTPAGANGVTVTIATADALKVIVKNATVFIPAGQTTGAPPPTFLAENVGDVNVTASAPGYANGVGLVKVGTTIHWTTPLVELAANEARVVFLPIDAAAPGDPPFPGDTGVKINFVSSDPNIVSIRQDVTAYPDGSEFTTIAVVITAHGTAGVATITAFGINIPAVVMTVTVGGPLTIATTSLPNGTVGTPYSTSLLGAGGVAPRSWSVVSGALPAGLNLNAATGVISGTPTVAVTASPITFRLTDNASPAASTQAALTLTITGGGGGGGASLSLAPSPLAISGTAVQNLNLTLSQAAPVGGLTVNLVSTNSTIATVPASLQVPANGLSLSIPVTGVAPGSTTITASANNYVGAGATVNVTAATGDILLPQGLVITPGEFKTFTVTLAQPAASATFINLTVSDPTVATLSQTSIFINPGQTAPAIQPRLNGISNGQVTLTANAVNLQGATTTARVGYALTFAPSTKSFTGLLTQNATLNLSASTGVPMVVTLTSADPLIATVPTTVTFGAGATSATVPVTSVGFGTVDITASAPDTFDGKLSVTVIPQGSITLAPVTFALGQSGVLPVSISSPAPAGGVTIALASSIPGRATVPATVTIPVGQTTPATPVMITGVNVGPTVITATASGLAPASATVNVTATAEWQAGTPIVAPGATQNVTLKLIASSANPVIGGVTVNLASSNPSVASVPPSVVFFPDGSPFTTISVPVSGLTVGTTVITADGLNIAPVTLLVTVDNPLTIGTPSLPSGSVGIAYSKMLVATGGNQPYSWALTGGTLPSGLTLTAGGLLSGTPTASALSSPLTFYSD